MTSRAGPERGEHAALGEAVRSTGLMTLGSRVFGLVRDVLIGRVFGDTAIGSAFAAAFAIPNMFRRLFGEGALSAAFVPEYAQAHKHDRLLAGQLASLTLRWLGLVTGVLTVVIELGLLAVLIWAPGDEERRLSIGLLMVMLPFMPFICVTAVLAGMLQVHGRFAAAASGPLLLNAFIIATGLYFVITGGHGNERVAYALGIATVLSGVTQAATFWWMLRREVAWSREDERAREVSWRMLRAFVPVMIGLGTLQLSTLIDTVIAMWPVWVGPTVLGYAVPLDERSNVIVSLTSRLYQFPLGVFGIAVATAAFPLLSRAADDAEKFIEVLRRGLRLSLLIGLPASIGLALVRHDLVGVMYGGGKAGFSDEGLARSASVLLGFSVAVWAYSLNHVLTRGFYARKDTKTPMRVAIWMMLVTVALTLVLIWPLGEAGLAWGTAIGQTLQMIVLMTLAGRSLHAGAILDGVTTRAMLRTLAMALVMGAAVWLTLWLWPEAPRWRDQLIRLIACCGVGGVVYLGLCAALRLPELGWLIKRRAA